MHCARTHNTYNTPKVAGPARDSRSPGWHKMDCIALRDTRPMAVLCPCAARTFVDVPREQLLTSSPSTCPSIPRLSPISRSVADNRSIPPGRETGAQHQERRDDAAVESPVGFVGRVSIPARSQDRALRGTDPPSPTSSRRFNPRPVPRPGATTAPVVALAVQTPVSIPDRSERRALQPVSFTTTIGSCGFNPARSQDQAQQPYRARRRRRACYFNPRSVARPGATRRRLATSPPRTCFNPRPAARPDAARRSR